MNQDNNQFNQNNSNVQGNNGVPNNQPLNNQNIGQNLSVNQAPLNYTNIDQSTQQSINNTFGSSNPSNGKPIKKLNVGLIIGIVVVIIVGIVVLMFSLNNNHKENQNNNSSNNNSTQNNNNITAKGFYIINDSQDRGSLAMATNFESEKADNYNYIEKYNMKWAVESKLYIMPVPVIPNRTYSLNGYSTEMVEMKSDILNLDYNILGTNIGKTEVQTLLQNTISEYSNGSVYTLSKNTEVVESNNTIGYAYSVKTFYSTQIRVTYYTKVTNNISSKSYILSGFLTFDISDYDNVKPIIEELSNTLGFDIVSLTEQVK